MIKSISQILPTHFSSLKKKKLLKLCFHLKTTLVVSSFKMSQSTGVPPCVPEAPPRASAARHWMGTIPESELDLGGLKEWLAKHCDRFTFQVERGETGYRHYQVALSLFKKQRLSFLRHHLCGKGHYEVSYLAVPF